jgi:hypothetical protein
MVPNEGRFDPYVFETYCTILLCDDVKSKKSIKLKIRDNQNKSNITDVTMKKCKGKEKVDNIIKAAQEKENILFRPTSTTNKLIDFVYREGCTPSIYHFFQCTIAEKHSATPQHIHKLVLEVMEITNAETISPNLLSSAPRIKIYYMVPCHRFRAFKTDPVAAKEKAHACCKQGSWLQEHWNSLVTINILNVEPPLSNAL